MADERQKIRSVERILVEKTAFLDEDERGACLKLWRAIARKRRIRGKPESWAAAVYYTYCRMVLRESASRKSVEELFNVSQGTFARRCTEIRKLFLWIELHKVFYVFLVGGARFKFNRGGSEFIKTEVIRNSLYKSSQVLSN